MTIKAPNHCAKQFSQIAVGLAGHHSYGPPPGFGPGRRKDNVLYVDVPVTVLPATHIASGDTVEITTFKDSRGYIDYAALGPGSNPSDRLLYVITIPNSLAIGDSVSLSLGGSTFGVDIPATVTVLKPDPVTGQLIPTQIPIVDTTPPPPAPVVITPTKPIAGRTNGNGNSPTTIPASIIGPSTPRQVVVPDPSDRQLVVYESNTANPNYGRLMGIPPGEAKGIGLPAYKIVTSLPLVGGVAGEAVFDTSTKAAFVWDGSNWQNMPPKAEVKPWDPALPYNQNTIVEAFDKLWLSTGAVPVNSAPSSSSTNWKALTGLMHTFEIWDAAKQYFINDLVLSGHALWKATVDSLNSEPPDWTLNTLSPEWEYQGLIPFDIGTPEEGGVLTWTGNAAIKGGVFQLTSPKAALKNWTGNEVYAPGQLVVYNHGIYNAILASPIVSGTTNPDLTPTLHQNNSHWEFWGSLPNALGEPLDGDTFVWDDFGKDWVYGSPGAPGGSAGYIENQLQAAADLTSSPRNSLSYIGYASLVSNSPGYCNPFLIAESNGAWVDMLDGGEMLYCQQNNHSAEIYGRVANKTSSEWGSSTAGMPILSSRAEFKPTVNDHIEFNLKFNRLDNDWWLLKATMASRVWGNEDGDSNTIFKIKASHITGLTKLGMKYLGTSTSNVLMGAIEWT